MKENLVDPKKKLYEHSLVEKIEPRITEIIMLETSKTYSFVDNNDIIDEFYANLLGYLSKFDPGIVEFIQPLFRGKDKSEVVLHIFNHPDFRDLYKGFLKYIDKELEMARNRDVKKFTDYRD